MAFDNKLKCDTCYNNYIHKKIEIKQVQKFNCYNITVILDIIYKHIIKYLNFFFSSNHNRLFAANLIRNFKITINQIFAYKLDLNNFAY